MQRLRCLALLYLAASTGAHAEPLSPAASGDIKAAVTALVQRWSDAGKAGDWDGIAATYADEPGFAWIEQGEARYTDHAGIVAGLKQAREMRVAVRNDVSDIVVTPLSPDAAAYRASYALGMTAEGFQVNSEGTLSGVAVKRGGTWRFLQGAFSERPTGGRPAP
jgi:ketosteroid isomerase-like protein